MVIVFDKVSEHRLYIELKPNHHTRMECTVGRYPDVLATLGVAFEQRAALIGINVQPAERSDTDSENMNRVVRSSRSCGYRMITAITRVFMIIFKMITTLITTGFISLYSVVFIIARKFTKLSYGEGVKHGMILRLEQYITMSFISNRKCLVGLEKLYRMLSVSSISM